MGWQKGVCPKTRLLFRRKGLSPTRPVASSHSCSSGKTVIQPWRVREGSNTIVTRGVEFSLLYNFVESRRLTQLKHLPKFFVFSIHFLPCGYVGCDCLPQGEEIMNLSCFYLHVLLPPIPSYSVF